MSACSDRSRREVIQSALWLGVGALGARLGTATERAAGERVVLIRNPEVLGGDGTVRGPVLTEMLDRAVTALVGAPSAREAWASLLRPGDVLGIKSNVWRHLATPPELEAAIRRRAVEAGVKDDAITVDDRKIASNPGFQNATALINVRPLRTHHWSGLGTCIKNYIMFVPEPWAYHDNACERLGAIWQLPNVKGKTRLNVLVMLTPQFHGVGPHNFNRAYTWAYYGLIVGRQPASVDAVGAAIITAQRRIHFGEDRPITPSPLHIQVAGSRYGLGPTDLAALDLVRLGEADGALI